MIIIIYKDLIVLNLFLGLFHKAIMESGTPLERWAVSPPGLARRRASALSAIAGCPSDLKELPSCLRQMPAELLVDLLNKFFVNNMCIILIFNLSGYSIIKPLNLLI